MTSKMQKSIRTYVHWLQHEGHLFKAPLHPFVSTAPMELVHVDFMSIKMTMELNRPPKVMNVMVFEDHFMKHIIIYVTPTKPQ